MASYTAKAEWAPKDMVLRDGTIVRRGTRIFHIYGSSSDFCVSEEEYWAKWASRVSNRSTPSRPASAPANRHVNGTAPVSTPRQVNRPPAPLRPMRIAPITYNPQRRRFSVSLMER